jgi:hypothetical protein
MISSLLSSSASVPKLDFLNCTHAQITWSGSWSRSGWGFSGNYDVELAFGPYSEDFEKVQTVGSERPRGANAAQVLSRPLFGLPRAYLTRNDLPLPSLLPVTR